jgi:hypothetical protein
MAVTVTAEQAADIYNRWGQLDLGFLCNPETGKLEGVNLSSEFGKWFEAEAEKLQVNCNDCKQPIVNGLIYQCCNVRVCGPCYRSGNPHG